MTGAGRGGEEMMSVVRPSMAVTFIIALAGLFLLQCFDSRLCRTTNPLQRRRRRPESMSLTLPPSLSPIPANRCHLFTSIVTENDTVLTKRPCDCPFLVADRSVARHIVSRYVLKQPQDQGC